MSTTFTLFNSLMKNTESLCKNGKCKDLSKAEKEDFVEKDARTRLRDHLRIRSYCSGRFRTLLGVVCRVRRRSI
jgi:hypothetical protein